ncbi:MAG: alanine--tRNA ligase [bacterium]
MKSREIRQKYLDFFAKRGHAVLPSTSLVPENDPSVLFNTAGMQPLVPYLLGEKHPLGTRLCSIQKCVRTIDLEEVGDNTHATFFEMMGNWSLGDYFKKESINWSFELLTSEEGFGLDANRLYVTCFEGNKDAPKDEESAGIWKEIFDKNGIKGNRIFFLPEKNNWWSAGDNGPCGADTEIFYDLTNTHTEGLSHEDFVKADSAQELVEIWNNVFMEFEKKDGEIIGKLANKNVDTGAGFERFAMVLEGKNNFYETDLFDDIFAKIEELITDVTPNASIDNGFNALRAKRIVADHVRTSVMLISDGVTPSNTDQGYILRRLLRRAVRLADNLGLKKGSLFWIADAVVNTYGDIYESLAKQKETIKVTIDAEEQKFRNTLSHGLKEFDRIVKKLESKGLGGADKDLEEDLKRDSNLISGKDAFILFSTYGFPVEMTIEMAGEIGKTVDREEFDEEMKSHQDLSRSGAGQKFKGGMGDTSDISIRYHTATHLLHQALRQVLGTHVSQKGSNITPERLRFDFAHTAKMTDEEKQKVEDIVNKKIEEALPVNVVELPIEEATKTGALHFFGEKYGDKVTLYYIGDTIDEAFSKEFCGGPHVKNTSELGHFKIQKEEAVAQGIRRIKAVLS